MHDAKGRPLKVGDLVLVPCRIKATQATEDYCNATLESVFSRRPDGMVETISGINTGIMLRANVGDENDITELQPQPEPAPEAKTALEPQPQPEPEAKAEPEQGAEPKEAA